jgi:hypothetical protein
MRKAFPRNKRQWQNAVDVAHTLLALDAAHQYGLVTGGPKIDIDRCIEILERGKQKGVEPSPTAIDMMISGIGKQHAPGD